MTTTVMCMAVSHSTALHAPECSRMPQNAQEGCHLGIGTGHRSRLGRQGHVWGGIRVAWHEGRVLPRLVGDAHRGRGSLHSSPGSIQARPGHGRCMGNEAGHRCTCEDVSSQKSIPTMIMHQNREGSGPCRAWKAQEGSTEGA